MRTLTIQDLRKKGGKAIPDQEVIYLIVNSKTKGVIVPPEHYEMLVDALEELEDIKMIEERRREATVPSSKVFPS